MHVCEDRDITFSQTTTETLLALALAQETISDDPRASGDDAHNVQTEQLGSAED